MKRIIARLFITTWFIGMFLVAVQGTPAQGEANRGMESTIYLPLVTSNAPVMGEPSLANYVGLVVANGDGDDEIYRVRADESEIEQLTNNESADRDPKWSPNGDHIVFVRAVVGSDDQYQAMVMNQDGSAIRSLGTLSRGRQVEMQWSPDSASLLVYVTDGVSLDRLLLVSVDGTVETLIAEGFLSRDERGWSPEGAYIHYVQRGVLWVYEPATGTKVEFEQLTVANGSAWSRPQILWHRNGSTLVFRAQRGAGGVGIVTTPDGLERRELFAGDYLLGGWLSAKEHLVLTLQEEPGEAIYTVPYAGGSITPLVVPEGNYNPVKFLGTTPSSDGILYYNLYSDGKLWLMPLVGDPTLILGGCFWLCGISVPSWAYNNSGILSTITYQTQEYPPASMSYVWYGTVGSASPQTFSFAGDSPRWEVEFFPFSSRFGWMQTATSPSSTSGWMGYMVRLDTVDRTTRRLFPALGTYVHVAEWRYLP
jgi:hypothetical protein